MDIFQMEILARVSGGTEVVMALDRLVCPLPDKDGMKKLMAAMGVIQKWVAQFDPAQQKEIQVMVGAHVKEALAEIKRQMAVDAGQ